MKKELIYLKQNQIRVLKKLYIKHRSSFLLLVKKHDPDNESPIEMYQDAFMTLSEHAINGKLDGLKQSVKTYLLTIGKHMIYDDLQKTRDVNIDEISIKLKEGFDESILFKEPELTPELQVLRKHFKNLGRRCQEIVTLFYYKRLSFDEITIHLDYENENIVKNQKSHCLKFLKGLIKP